jgi:hypothetical protein
MHESTDANELSKAKVSKLERLNSSVGIATGYRLGYLVGSRIFSSPRRPDRLWGPLNLSNGYWV